MSDYALESISEEEWTEMQADEASVEDIRAAIEEADAEAAAQRAAEWHAYEQDMQEIDPFTPRKAA